MTTPKEQISRIQAALPELPEPDSYCTHKDSHEYDVYTADQMRAYAKAHAASLEDEVKALREALNALVDRDFTTFDGNVIGISPPISFLQIREARAALSKPQGVTS
ncbi:MAG: hypothetical protein V4451_16250 [Pseudomonadota bacterium]